MFIVDTRIENCNVDIGSKIVDFINCQCFIGRRKRTADAGRH